MRDGNHHRDSPPTTRGSSASWGELAPSPPRISSKKKKKSCRYLNNTILLCSPPGFNCLDLPQLTLSYSQGPIPPLQPPYRASIPLWLGLLLKRQHRANIVPPPWLIPSSLDSLLRLENSLVAFSPPPPPSTSGVSPPFVPSATASAPQDALPFHWLELGEMLLDAAADDIPEPNTVRRLMRDLREVRMAKMRAGVGVLEGNREVKMNGVGGMEVAEGRAFILGVVDGLR